MNSTCVSSKAYFIQPGKAWTGSLTYCCASHMPFLSPKCRGESSEGHSDESLIFDLQESTSPPVLLIKFQFA